MVARVLRDSVEESTLSSMVTLATDVSVVIESTLDETVPSVVGVFPDGGSGVDDGVAVEFCESIVTILV